jgi:hypothetical protein
MEDFLLDSAKQRNILSHHATAAIRHCRLTA